MKKLLALALAVMMLLGLAVTAVAEESKPIKVGVCL